jgi:phosphomannomutase/phosphoglucomutase
MLSEAVIAGLLSQGNDVDDCQLITTPALQFLVKHTSAAAAVMVTASHNPSEYNGFKIVDSDGVEISRDKEIVIERLVARNSWRINNNPGERLGRSDPAEPYLAELSNLVKEGSSLKQMRIVVDIGNGVAGLTTPILLRRLGCQVITLNDNIDGSFPGRPSEPRPENLSALSEVVKSEHASFGVAHDGDGDRAIFVDETGTIHLGDRSLALIADEVLRENVHGTIVTPLNSSLALKEIAENRHGRLIFTKVGSIFVSRTMLKEKAILGGEENGGIFYSPHHPVRDGTMATILILNALMRSGQSLSKLIGRLPKLYMSKEKMDCPDNKKIRAMENLRRRLGSKVTSDLDGLRIDLADGWLLVRPSGTEPLIRIYAEARTEETLQKMIDEYRPMILGSISSENCATLQPVQTGLASLHRFSKASEKTRIIPIFRE